MIIGLIIFCCWIVSFFFNGIESGLLSIDPIRLRQNVKRRVPAAVRLNRLLKHPERRLFYRSGNCASGLFVSAFCSSQIAFSAISLSRPGATCRRTRTSIAPVLTIARTRCATGQADPAESRRQTRSSFCGTRGPETDHRTKRARGLPHCYGARDDS
ncbi:MAG: hypothetical protein DME55_06455 [Verrucomicrobia bacterium]|nr:MAG: hypothetical protein DME55_06455 [Verrucomicrobiota bacterium]